MGGELGLTLSEILDLEAGDEPPTDEIELPPGSRPAITWTDDDQALIICGPRDGPESQRAREELERLAIFVPTAIRLSSSGETTLQGQHHPSTIEP